MNAPTNGWIGIGFTPSSSMEGADMILMGVREGEAYALVQDNFLYLNTGAMSNVALIEFYFF